MNFVCLWNRGGPGKNQFFQRSKVDPNFQAYFSPLLQTARIQLPVRPLSTQARLCDLTLSRPLS